MKNSFFLVIPKQQLNPQQLKEFEAKMLEQWIAELPVANPLMATRLFYEYLVDFNTIKMPAQLKLDALELLMPSLLAIEDYLRSKLMRSGFPKEESDKKTLALLVGLEKQFTLGYWIILKELTAHDIGWFQGKNAALSIQRCIKGLSRIVMSYFMMGMPVPDWIWMDLHSLYKLSLTLKKNATQVAANDINRSNKTGSPEESYLQIILLSLADPRGLMQKEIKLVYGFIETIQSLVSLSKEEISSQAVQCVIFIDEDRPPRFCLNAGDIDTDSTCLYLNFTKLYQAFEQEKILANLSETRFGAKQVAKSLVEKPAIELLHYLEQRWSGINLQSAPLFNDRLDRYLAIGLTSTFKLQKALPSGSEDHPEYLVQSVSNRLLSGIFKPGILSVGSLVSFRRIDMPEHKRFLGIVDMLVVEKEEGKINFGVQLLTPQSIAVTYLPLNATSKDHPKLALFYKANKQDGVSYIIVDTFMLKDDDVVRLNINQEDFPIILKNKKNIGLGYWRFECMKVTEKRK